MLITEITRSYRRSINARNYGLPESHITIDSSYTATIESGDDPIKVSEMLYEQCKKEVVANVDAIVSKMKESASRMQNTAAVGPTGPVNGSSAPRSL